ncbi:hypothetical protein D3C80_1763820 [compost metagenome]
MGESTTTNGIFCWITAFTMGWSSGMVGMIRPSTSPRTAKLVLPDLPSSLGMRRLFSGNSVSATLDSSPISPMPLINAIMEGSAKA